MITINNSLFYVLQHQQENQHDTTTTLWTIQQSQKDNAYDILTDEMPTFDGMPELYFNWILKLENLVTFTKPET